MKRNSEEKFDIYKCVTEKILAKLDTGVIPWRMPWKRNGSAGLPRNFVTGKAYRGLNVWLLSNQTELPFWLTLKQANDIGAKVRKGEKSSFVTFWSILKKIDPATNEEKKIFFLRYYLVFNVDQVDGIKPERLEKMKAAFGLLPTGDAPAFNPIARAAEIVEGFTDKPLIRHKGDSAHYTPALDIVTMPKAESFETPEAYYQTLFHELTHSTGHASRLNRDGITKAINFGSERYSREELVAEFGASYLSELAGIGQAVIDNSASYIANWSSALRGDSKLFISAASQAQKAADYILADSESEDELDTEKELANA